MTLVTATANPPLAGDQLWYREDFVLRTLQEALEETIKTHGHNSKAFAWDARHNFKRRLSA